MLKNILFILFLLISSLMADQHVSVTATVNRAEYADKNMQNLQKILVDKAKLEAASQIFGDFIKSESMVKDGSLVKDLIVAEKGGIIHIQGNPEFANGKNLGELQVSINAYATQKDIEDMKIHRIEIKNYVYGNKNLTLIQLKEEAKKAFVIEAISKQKPSIKTAPNAADQAKRLASSINIQNMDFDPENLSFSMSGYVEYIPIFLRNTDGVEAQKHIIPSLAILEDTASITLLSGQNNYRSILKHNGNGFIFNNNILEQIKLFHSKNTFFMRINMRVMVPETIEGEKVSMQIMGAPAFVKGVHGYKFYINDTLLPEGYGGITTDVVHDGAQRFINVSILMSQTGYSNFTKLSDNIIAPLSNIYFTCKKTDNDEPKIAKISTLTDPTDTSTAHHLIMNMINKNGTYSYDITNNTMGFLVTQNIFNVFGTLNENEWFRGRINARLLIPNEIDTEKVKLQINGATAQNDQFLKYSIYINDTKMLKIGSSVETDVIHDGNNKYVKLSLIMDKSNYFGKDQMAQQLMQLSGMHFVASDGNKYYALSTMIPSQSSSPVTLHLENKKYYFDYEIIHNGLGFSFSPEMIQTLQSMNQDGNFMMNINFKLPVPAAIKNDNVTLKLNGMKAGIKGSNGYVTSINGNVLPDISSTIKTKVQRNGSQRYINVSFTVKRDGYMNLSYLIDNFLLTINGMNFSISEGKQFYDAPLSHP